MKKLILLFILTISSSSAMCETLPIFEATTFSIYIYDNEATKYVKIHKYVEKYGLDVFLAQYELSKQKKELKPSAYEYIIGPYKDEIQLHTAKKVSEVHYENTVTMLKNREVKQKKTYKINLTHAAVGGGIIVVSGAGYMIGMASINDAITTNRTEYAEATTGGIADETEIKALADDFDKLNKSKSTIGYICGGATIIGAVVVLTGIKQNPDGSVPLTKNLQLKATDNVSFAWKF